MYIFEIIVTSLCFTLLGSLLFERDNSIKPFEKGKLKLPFYILKIILLFPLWIFTYLYLVILPKILQKVLYHD